MASTLELPCVHQLSQNHCPSRALNLIDSLAITIESFPQTTKSSTFYYYTGIRAEYRFYTCKQSIVIGSPCK